MDPATPASNDNKEKKTHSEGHNSRGRGRARGRGQGRTSANVIQTHSLFEQGPTEKLSKPSGGNIDRLQGLQISEECVKYFHLTSETSRWMLVTCWLVSLRQTHLKQFSSRAAVLPARKKSPCL